VTEVAQREEASLEVRSVDERVRAAQMLVERVAETFARKGVHLFFVPQRGAVVEYIQSWLPEGAVVTARTSLTLKQCGVEDYLRSGKFRYIKEEIRSVPSSELRSALRRWQVANVQYAFGSVNALAATGEMVCIDGSGSGIALYLSAPRVCLVVGINKLCGTLQEAIYRARHWAAVLEALRMRKGSPCEEDGICHMERCFPPVRQCGKMLICDGEVLRGRTEVLVVGERLGF